MRARLIRWLIGGDDVDMIRTMLDEERREFARMAQKWAGGGRLQERDNAIARHDRLAAVIPLFIQQDWA